MAETGIKNPMADLSSIGFKNLTKVHWNLSQAELAEITIKNSLGVLSDKGAIAIDTGEFTGRSPKDKFIVKDNITENTVNWSDSNNQPFDGAKFNALEEKLKAHLVGKEVYVKDAFACADPTYKLNIRLITELPWAAMFAGNMFLATSKEEIKSHKTEWTIIHCPSFHANPKTDGTRQHNFAVLNFTKKMIIIGGTAYTGEIKKGIFTVLNFVLPVNRNVFPMHCSANIGDEGDTTVFFGLSGTGKTTLSADPNRKLIGDDEHGWSDKGVFNFEGGCYAKCIDLTEEKEPDIYAAIKFGAILENIRFYPGTRTVNYSDVSVTENTRVSYPLSHISNAIFPSMGGVPKNIFFLACDAFGVLPPISRLTPGQAMYYFLSGYTAKVAGTETGITEPKLTFSSCFGAPFLPLHSTKYAEMLGVRMKEHNVKVWLVNTGWNGGPYGVGSRIKLSYTRAMITAALNGTLDNVKFEIHPVFGLESPVACQNVPGEVLNPRNTWKDKNAYDDKANELAKQFTKNFEKFSTHANKEIVNAGPKIAVGV
jgi:phosphoenolpyruvate carboxykinase (ATP)